jgi:hypothetical protein
MAMEKIDCSVVVLAKKSDSDKTQACLDTVQWAKEIIVVDEAQRRNQACAAANQSWVLSLDAGERVTPDLAEEIKQTIALNPKADAFSIARRHCIGRHQARHGGMSLVSEPKLFRKSYARAKSPGLSALKYELRYEVCRDFSEAIAVLDRETDLAAEEWFRNNRKIGIFSAIRKAVSSFFKMYVIRKGYQDGVVGLFLAVNSGMEPYLTYLKCAELKNGASRVPNA